MQVRHKVSILVLAHDTTKAATRALTNLADSELTITESKDKEEKTDVANEKIAQATATVKKADESKGEKINLKYHHSDPYWDDIYGYDKR